MRTISCASRASPTCIREKVASAPKRSEAHEPDEGAFHEHPCRFNPSPALASLGHPSPARGASHGYPDPRFYPNINWLGRGEQRPFDGRLHRGSTRAKLGRTGATVRYPVHSVRSKIVAASAKIRKPTASNSKISLKTRYLPAFFSWAEGNQFDWAIVVGSVWSNVTAAQRSASPEEMLIGGFGTPF